MDRPVVKLVGENGNIFNLLGLASRALKRAGKEDEAKLMVGRCMRCRSYHEALAVIMEYVEPM